MKWNNRYSPDWQRRFALTPQHIEDGVVVWLRRYEERYVQTSKGEPCACGSHIIGRWERRIPESASP